LKKAYSLLIALAAGGVIGLLRSFGDLAKQLGDTGRPQVWLENLKSYLLIPDQLPFPRWLNPIGRGQMANLAFEPSVLLIGAGMIVGLRVSLSMLAGAVFLYFVVAPQLYLPDLQNLQTPVPGYVPSFQINPQSFNFNPVRWGLWGGTAVMVFSSLASLALQWRTIGRAFSVLRRRGNPACGSSQPSAMDAIEVPISWLVAGLIPITIGLVIVQSLAFHISIPLGLIAVALSFLISMVCCRATGETDTNPIGPMGKVTQLLYAILPGARGVISTNLMAAGLTSSAGSAAADLLTDLKTGYILGANPRKQFLAQFFGVFFGTLSIIPAWYLMVPTKAKLESFNPPATNMWKAVADLLTGGIQMLSMSARWAIVIGAIVGVLLPLVAQLAPKSRPWLPSAMGLGLSWVIPFTNSLAFAIGAVIVFIWEKLNKKNAYMYNIPIASGLVAGESLVAALIAILCTIVGFMAVKQ
jgi:uncharacterized oligopeptide transporter (OPT) family protein